MSLRPVHLPRSVSILLYILCGTAIILTLVQHILSSHSPFDFVSADVSTMARSFARHGVLKLAGVPINNNDPVGSSPAVYVHWPPLLPILLSGLFRLFGESEPTAHVLMAVVLLATAIVIYAIARHFLPAEGACLALIFYLTLPVVVRFSQNVSQQALAIFFMLLALLAFLRATNGGGSSRLWSAIACAAMCLAIWSSWEPIWLPVSLLGVAAWRRHENELRLAKLLCFVSLAAVSIVASIYLIHAPESFVDTMRTVGYRVGISQTYSAAPLNRHAPNAQIGLVRILHNLYGFYPEMLGLAGIAAVAWLVLTIIDRLPSSSINGASTVFAGLLGPWFIWYGTMWNHVGVHKFEMLLAAPGTAVAMAYGATSILNTLQTRAERTFWRATSIVVIVPVLCLVPLASKVRHYVMRDPSRKYFGFLPAIKRNPSLFAPDWNVRYANLVHDSTPPGAIVFTPLQSAVPVFYSGRHVVRNVENDADLTQTLQLAQLAFPGAPFFLALPAGETSSFSQSIARSDLVGQTQEGAVYRLSPRTF